jgi:DNA polymerase III delta subunit
MSPGSPIKPKQLRSELNSGKIYTRYLFTGEEEGDKEKIIQRIRTSLFPEPGEARISTGTFHAEQDELLQAADFALSTSMFSRKLLCIIKNIDRLKQSKSSSTLLDDLLTGLPLSTTLILTTRKNKPPVILKKELISDFRTVQFWRYFENDLSRYAVSKFNNAGVPVSGEAVDQILKYTGRDIKKVDDAVELLIDSGIKGEISREDVMRVVADTRESSLFDFAESLFLKNNESLNMLKKILEEGRSSELSILGIITRQAEMIEKYHSLIIEGADINSAIKACGVFDSKREVFLRSTEMFGKESIKKIFTLISKTDRRIKSESSRKSLINNPVFALASDIILSY